MNTIPEDTSLFKNIENLFKKSDQKLDAVHSSLQLNIANLAEKVKELPTKKDLEEIRQEMSDLARAVNAESISGQSSVKKTEFQASENDIVFMQSMIKQGLRTEAWNERLYNIRKPFKEAANRFLKLVDSLGANNELYYIDQNGKSDRFNALDRKLIDGNTILGKLTKIANDQDIH